MISLNQHDREPNTLSFILLERLCYMKHFTRFLFLGLVMGVVYTLMELLYRGYSHWTMVFVGGTCGILVGILNERRKMAIWKQCIVGTGIILLVEFISGCIVNLYLGWHVWDYSNAPLNILGQICLPYSMLWFIICPFAIWIDDWLRWKLYDHPQPIKLWCEYVYPITGK